MNNLHTRGTDILRLHMYLCTSYSWMAPKVSHYRINEVVLSRIKAC